MRLQISQVWSSNFQFLWFLSSSFLLIDKPALFRQELIIYNMSRLSSVGFWCRVRIKDRERHLGRELCSIISFWYLAKLQVNDLAESKCVVVNKYCVGKLNMARLKVTHNISTQRKAFGIPHGQQHWGEKVKWLNENQLSSIRFLFATETGWLRKARSLKKQAVLTSLAAYSILLRANAW